MNKEQIRREIFTALEAEDIWENITVYRDKINEFKEPMGEEKVCDVKGYYYTGQQNKINLSIGESATVTNNFHEKLLIVYDDISVLIKEKDHFLYKDKKYQIINKGNVQDIIFDMTLERV